MGMSCMAWRRGILIQRFLNSPRMSKSGETIGLGRVNLSGNGGRDILGYSGPCWSIVSFSCPPFVSVIFSWLGSVEVPGLDWCGIAASAGDIVRPDLILSSLHWLSLVSGFGSSMIWISWSGFLLGLGLVWDGNWGRMIGWGLFWTRYSAGSVGWF